MTDSPNRSRHERVARATTLLFVPGDRPDRFAKASSSGADVVIVDLEDAVSPENKLSALNSAIAALQPESDLKAVVRLNPVDSSYYRAEVDQLGDLVRQPGHGVLGLMIAKAEGVEVIRELHSLLPDDIALVPLIETARGLLQCDALTSEAGVTRFAFGAVDFALDVGSSTGDRFLDSTRSALVVRSRAAGIAAPIDSPSIDIADEAAVFTSAQLARDFGFTGKLCIHPRQVDIVARAFAPTEAELAWARAVVEADRMSAGAAASLNGMMIDRPVVARARRTLERLT